MKKILLIFSILISIITLSAQNETVPNTTESSEDADVIFTVVEQMPEFTGGQKAMDDFLAKNLNYPTMAKEKGIQGKVWVEFIIDKEGNVTNVQIKRGIGGGCDEESVRVVKLMPKWIPGKQSGKPVSVKYVLPINYVLK